MARFLIRAPRFLADAKVGGRQISGEIVYASPEHPTEIELPDDVKVDAGLIPVGSPAAAEKLKPHYAERAGRAAQSAKELMSKPLPGKRPSDSEG